MQNFHCIFECFFNEILKQKDAYNVNYIRTLILLTDQFSVSVCMRLGEVFSLVLG